MDDLDINFSFDADLNVTLSKTQRLKQEKRMYGYNPFRGDFHLLSDGKRKPNEVNMGVLWSEGVHLPRFFLIPSRMGKLLTS